MESIGYATRTFVFPSSSIGARHKRDRVWIIGRDMADTESLGCGGGDGLKCGDKQRKILEEEQGRSSLGSEVEGCRESHGNLSDSKSERIQRLWSSWEQESDTHGQSVISVCQGERPPETIWQVEPRVDRVVDGLPKRVDRIKGLGNAIVPQNAMMIANAIEKTL